MTDKERLKNIDENKELNVCGITGKPLSVELSIKEYSYLHTQAKRVQELENTLKSHAPEGRNYTNKQYIELLNENRRYREAVEKIEELYNEIHSRTARGCANDYLDGLETALHIIQRGE